MNRTLRALFFLLFVRPLVLLVLGVNARHRERLPTKGPAIIAANHNSHLDTLVLMTLFPQAMLPVLRPVAAADYFLRHRLLAWFARRIIGIVPLSRSVKPGDPDPLAACDAALAQGDILIIFPEGSRGEPERFGDFKTGIAHLARRHTNIPVVPVFMHGLGKILPRGALLLVPFFVDVFIGEALHWPGDRAVFMGELDRRIRALGADGVFPSWE